MTGAHAGGILVCGELRNSPGLEKLLRGNSGVFPMTPGPRCGMLMGNGQFVESFWKKKIKERNNYGFDAIPDCSFILVDGH
jgi:hypothetical protein